MNGADDGTITVLSKLAECAHDWRGSEGIETSGGLVQKDQTWIRD